MTWVNITPEENGLIWSCILGLIGGALFTGWIGLQLDPYVHENYKFLFLVILILFWIGIPVSFMTLWHFGSEKQRKILSKDCSKPEILRCLGVYFLFLTGITLLIVSASAVTVQSENLAQIPNFSLSSASAHGICVPDHCSKGEITAIIKNQDNSKYKNIPIKLSIDTNDDVRFFYTYYTIKDISPYESINVTIPEIMEKNDVLTKFNWSNISVKMKVFPINFDYKLHEAKKTGYNDKFEPDTKLTLLSGKFRCGYFRTGNSDATPSLFSYVKNNNTVRFDVVKMNFKIYDKNKVRLEEGNTTIYSIEPDEKVEYIGEIKKDTMDRCLNGSLSLDYEIFTLT
jgi:hypothetical protein